MIPSANDPAHDQALGILRDQCIDLRNLETLEKKWTVVDTSWWQTKGAPENKRIRKLLQWFISFMWLLASISDTLISRCGYCTQSRQSKELQSKSHDAMRAEEPLPWRRRAPFDFTECLAHIDVTYILEPLQVLRIRGVLEHNDKCKAASVSRLPAVPLHPEVYGRAVRQLLDGAS